MEFYEWLRKQFIDIKTAKIFYLKWKDECDQETPYGCFTMRAMAAHISNVLEGKEYDEDGVCTNYMSTKYGSIFYTLF